MDQDSFETKEYNNKSSHYKKLIVIALVVLGVSLLTAGILWQSQEFNAKEQVVVNEVTSQEVSTDTPIDIVLDFYGPWLDAMQSTSTDPYKLGLPTTKILSETLRTQLIASEGRAETEIDPVLCQTTVPERGRARMLFQKDDTASVLVNAKEPGITAQSVFALKRQNEGWYIDNITCYPGEFEAPREFSFEKEGYLLKNVPPPLDAQYWHIVFEDNGEKGHTVPLLFNVESTCVAVDGSTAVCAPDQFTEASKVHVYSQMTELGADVVRLEFIQYAKI